MSSVSENRRSESVIILSKTSESFHSSQDISTTVLLRIQIPFLNLRKTIRARIDENVWTIQLQVITWISTKKLCMLTNIDTDVCRLYRNWLVTSGMFTITVCTAFLNLMPPNNYWTQLEISPNTSLIRIM
jgi:hypothetical protein